jgi:hypothetical protein
MKSNDELTLGLKKIIKSSLSRLLVTLALIIILENISPLKDIYQGLGLIFTLLSFSYLLYYVYLFFYFLYRTLIRKKFITVKVWALFGLCSLLDSISLFLSICMVLDGANFASL